MRSSPISRWPASNIGLVLPPLSNDPLFYELALGLLVLATLTVFWIARSRFGIGLIAIRENEEAAAVMGVNTTLYKVLAFALSASSPRSPAASTPTGSPSSIPKAPSTSPSTCG